MIKSGSHKTSLKEIKETIMEYNFIHKVEVFGHKDEILGEKFVAFVVLKYATKFLKKNWSILISVPFQPSKQLMILYFKVNCRKVLRVRSKKDTKLNIFFSGREMSDY